MPAQEKRERDEHRKAAGRPQTFGALIDEYVWALPASRNKGKRDHEVPLSPIMVELLGKLRRRGERVFTVDGVKPYAGTYNRRDYLHQKHDASAANRAIELLGRSLGMFVERRAQGRPGDFAGLSDAELVAKLVQTLVDRGLSEE